VGAGHRCCARDRPARRRQAGMGSSRQW